MEGACALDRGSGAEPASHHIGLPPSLSCRCIFMVHLCFAGETNLAKSVREEQDKAEGKTHEIAHETKKTAHETKESAKDTFNR